MVSSHRPDSIVDVRAFSLSPPGTCVKEVKKTLLRLSLPGGMIEHCRLALTLLGVRSCSGNPMVF